MPIHNGDQMTARYFVTEKKGRKKEHAALCIDKDEAIHTMEQLKKAYPDSIFYIKEAKVKA